MENKDHRISNIKITNFNLNTLDNNAKTLFTSQKETAKDTLWWIGKFMEVTFTLQLFNLQIKIQCKSWINLKMNCASDKMDIFLHFLARHQYGQLLRKIKKTHCFFWSNKQILTTNMITMFLLVKSH